MGSVNKQVFQDLRIIQDDIDEGTRHSCQLCPVAHAASRKFNVELGHIWAGMMTITVDRESYYVSKPLQEWMVQFDVGRRVEPGTFKLLKVVN